MSKEERCYVAATEQMTPTMKIINIHKPSAGTWKIIVRNRDQVAHFVNYTLREARLTPTATPIEAGDAQHASGTSWTIPSFPQKHSYAQYAPFRIAGTPGVAREKNGLVIAMTPLDVNAP